MRFAGAARSLDRAWTRIEGPPIIVVTVAAGATIATAVALGSFAGWPRVLSLVNAPFVALAPRLSRG